MKIVAVATQGDKAQPFEMETNQHGNIVIPPLPEGFDEGTVWKLYGDADSRSPTFRMFRTLTEFMSLRANRTVNARHDLHNLSADELPIPKGNGISSDELAAMEHALSVNTATMDMVNERFPPEPELPVEPEAAPKPKKKAKKGK